MRPEVYLSAWRVGTGGTLTMWMLAKLPFMPATTVGICSTCPNGKSSVIYTHFGRPLQLRKPRAIFASGGDGL